MRVLTADAAGEDGAEHLVDLGIVGPVAQGERLIVHAGAALSRDPA